MHVRHHCCDVAAAIDQKLIIDDNIVRRAIADLDQD